MKRLTSPVGASLTPAAAAAKTCPLLNTACLTGDCMMWQWTVAAGDFIAAEPVAVRTRVGKRNAVRETVLRERPAKDADRRGLCTLRGRP